MAPAKSGRQEGPTPGTRRVVLPAIVALAVFLVLAALTGAAADNRGLDGASGGDSPPPDGVCDRFMADLDSGAPAGQVAARFGLPENVPAPAGISVDNVYCFGRDELDGSGAVLGVAVEDVDTGDVWLVFGDEAQALSRAQWQSTLNDHGWQRAGGTHYGFTTRPGNETDLWSEVSNR